MRTDQAVIAGTASLAAFLVLARGIDGPTWGVAGSILAAVVYLLTTRDRGERAAPLAVSAAVLIPVKDNVGTIADVVRRSLAHGLPVYVIDDGSTDGSGAAAASCGPSATVIRHRENLGKGQALLTGMRAAQYAGHTHAICLDADGQHDPGDIPAFAIAIAESPNAIIAGVRDLSSAPGRSQFGRKFSNFWVWVETDWRLADTQCGFRAYPIEATLALGLGGTRYDLEVEVFSRSIWAGTPVRDLPCRVYYPPPNQRVSSFDPLRDNARISWMNARLVVRRLLWPPFWFARIVQRDYGWSGRSKGFAAGWRFVLAVLRLGGRKPAYVLVNVLAAWYALVAATPGIRAYLARYAEARGGQDAPPPGLAGLYRNFAVTIIDRLLFLLQGPPAFPYVSEGAEHIIELFASGGILLTAHMGNTEVAAGGPGASERMRKLTVVRVEAEGDHGRGLLLALPTDWQPRIIAVNRSEGFSTLSILRDLRAGAVVAMHGDRMVDDRKAVVQFLGAPMEVPVGPYLLAALADVPVIVAGCFKEGDTYRIVGEAPRRYKFDRSRPREEQLQAWAQAYAERLETWVRRWPGQWYNFHDVWGRGRE